jgi:hypothetical protein
MAHSERHNEVLEWLALLDQPIMRIDKTVADLLQVAAEKERYEMLDWMSTQLFGAHYDNIAHQRMHHTSEWVIGHGIFKTWEASSSSSVLWLHGTGMSFHPIQIHD